jgi:hypothetical protein
MAELRALGVKRLGRTPGPLRDQPATVIALPSVAPELDHGLIEAVLARIQKKSARAEYWRDHVAILFEVMVGRGLSEAVAEAVLRDHLAQVRRINSERMALTKGARATARSPISFSEPPTVGSEIAISGKVAQVVALEPYTRKDGAESLIIHWEVEGRKATSGLRSAGVKWDDQTRGDRDD